MRKKQTKPAKPLETPPTFDRTVWRESFRTNLSAAVVKATQQCGLSRVQTIADMLEFADELCQIAEAEGESLEPLKGLLA